MDKNQSALGAPAGAISTRNRQVVWTRFFVLALFLALTVFSFHSKTAAQTADKVLRVEKASLPVPQAKAAARNCPECEQAYVQCLANGGGGSCLDRYEACLAGCH